MKISGHFYLITKMKTCSKCKLELSIDSFNKDKTKKDGLTSSCKECKRKVDNNYFKNNEEKIKRYYEDNKEKIKELSLRWRLKNPEYMKNWKQKNKLKTKEHAKTYQDKRLKTDPIFKLKLALRVNIGNAFKRGNNQFKKTASTEKILGCTIEEFMIYIENKFTDGMSFDNYGEWHLDHIIPLAFAKSEESVILLNHYTNFQPLWAFDNLSKGCKI